MSGMHKLQRLNSANAAFRDRRLQDDGLQRTGGVMQASLASGPVAGSTLAAVGGGSLGGMGTPADMPNQDGNGGGGQRYQNQSYQINQSQLNKHAMRVREQRASASAGRDGGLNSA
jgi:hypothetical protein